MNKVIKITHCRGRCPFFFAGMDGMECNHPYFDDKPCYTNMIISHDDLAKNNGIPSKCPLRLESIEIKYELVLDES